MDFRYTAHDSVTGDPLDLRLPPPTSQQIGDVFGERGTLQLSFSSGFQVPTFLEVRLEVSHGAEWASVGPAFIRLGGSHEDTDPAGIRNVEFVSREWVLQRARVGEGELELIDGKRPFYQASPGEILRTLILEAQDRGSAAGIELSDFNANTDSSGQPWSRVATIYYSPGLPVGDVLQNLVDQGMCDYRLVGRTLEVYNPETTLGRDLTDGVDPVRVHGSVTESPAQYTLTDLANNFLLIGEEGFQVEVDNPEAPLNYGRLEVTIEQGGVNQEGTARSMIEAELQKGSREAYQITRSQTLSGNVRFLPYRDYRVGDFVQVHDRGAWQKYRVREIQFVKEGPVWKAHVTLNDRLQELLLQLAKRTNGIVNGTHGSGGDGTTPAPPPNPGIEPRAPEGLVVNQQVYLDRDGLARGTVTAGWAEVTLSTRGVPVDVGAYELWWRENDTYGTWQLAARTDGDTSAAHSRIPLTNPDGSPAEYQWRVRAVAAASGRVGLWSSPVTLTMTQDTTPPPPPSTPTVSTGFRIVTVEWDGLNESGTQMPSDFAEVRVYLAGSEGLAGARRVGSLPYAGSWNSETLEPDVPVWVALTAVDRVGNESDPTPAVSVTPRSLVSDETIQDAIDQLEKDIEDVVVDASGTKNFFQPDAPQEGDSPEPREGDLWFDTSDQNKPYIYRSGEWVSARDESFLSTARNMTPWTVGVGDAHALAGQALTVPSGEMRFQSGVFPAFPAAETVGVVLGDVASPGSLLATTTLPWQGVASTPGGVLSWSNTAVPFEGRPVGVEGTALFHATGQPAGAAPSVEVEATFFDAAGNNVGLRRRLIVRARELDPDDPTESVFLDGYGMTHIAVVDGALEPASSVADTAEFFAMSWHLRLPRASGNTATILSAEARVQVPESGIAPGAITETKIGPEAITTPKLAARAVVAEKIAVGAITADSGIVGSLNAGVITVGEMDGVRIKAGSILGDRLLVGRTSSLIPWSTDTTAPHQGANGGAWSVGDNDGSGPHLVLTAPGGSSGTWADVGRLVGDGPFPTERDYVVPLMEGERYKFSVRTSPGAGWSGNARLRVDWLAADDSFAGLWIGPGVDTSDTDSWTLTTGITPEAPAGTVAALVTVQTTLNSSGPLKVREARFERSVGRTLIEDGAVSTEQLAANAVKADQIDVGALDGKVITGATVRTSAEGARVELNQTGLRAYNPAGEETLVVSSSTGSVSILGGSLRTSAQNGTFVELSGTARDGWPGLAFTTPNLYRPGGVAAYDGQHTDFDVWPNGAVVLNSGRLSSAASATTTAVAATPERVLLLARGGSGGNDSVLQVGGTYDSDVSAGNRSALQVASGVAVLTSGVGTSIGADTNGSVWSGGSLRGDTLRVLSQLHTNSIAPQGNPSFLLVNAESSELRLNGGVGSSDRSVLRLLRDGSGPAVVSPTVFNRTFSGSANVYINGTGTLGRISSSRRYKRNVSDWKPDPEAVLGLHPRQWQHDDPNSEVDERWHVGFVAEEVHDLGLHRLVDYTVNDSGDWVPESLSYDRFAAAQQVVLQKHERELAELRDLVHHLTKENTNG